MRCKVHILYVAVLLREPTPFDHSVRALHHWCQSPDVKMSRAAILSEQLEVAGCKSLLPKPSWQCSELVCAPEHNFLAPD